MANFAKAATALIGGVLLSSTALATETITYTYDARGRLVKVVHTGTVNNNNQACYKYDKADNRSNVQVNVGSLPACP
jgi:YD repeat-containing protein